MNRVSETLGPLALGLALAGASHPAFAGLIGASGRPLTVGHIAELALNHLTLAATGLTLVAALGIGLGLIATRARFDSKGECVTHATSTSSSHDFIPPAGAVDSAAIRKGV